jgi:CheY-like chemotaxis protein
MIMPNESAQAACRQSSHALMASPVRLPAAIRPNASCKVLIVDSNEITTQILATTLEIAGYAAIVSDPLHAESALRASRVDLVLQSLSIKEMRYWELAEFLHQIMRIPIVGYASLLPAETRAAQRQGFAGFLNKPFAPSHLARTLPFYLWNKACPQLPAPASGSFESRETATLRATLPERSSRLGSVLVVEDNPFQLQRLSEAFADAGFTVTRARHGIEALEKLGRSKPDLMVSDTLMTGCDGFELCLTIRRLPSMSDLPVLLTPATPSDAVDEAVAHAIGVDAYISRSRGLERLVDAARLLTSLPRNSHGQQLSTAND